MYLYVDALRLALEKDGPYNEATASFLDRLPPLEKQRKMLRRLDQIAACCRCSLSDFQWWDIDHHKRVLLVKVFREGQVVVACLIWETTLPGTTDKDFTNGMVTGWMRDVAIPQGWHYEIEAKAYQHVRKLFRAWLVDPLPPFPDRYTVVPSV